VVLRCSHTPELLLPGLVRRMLGVITDLLGESSLVAIARHEIVYKLSGIFALTRFRSNKTFPKTHRFLQVSSGSSKRISGPEVHCNVSIVKVRFLSHALFGMFGMSGMQ
jgi:hypothetical protein